MPTAINPICEAEEQASIRFTSTEQSASNAPSSMVTTPSAKMVSPQRKSFRNIVTDNISIPSTPHLVSMLESSALPVAGAAGYAIGIQKCSGNRPALAAKPNSISPPARYFIHAGNVEKSICRSSSKPGVPPDMIVKVKSPISSTRPPSTVTAR